MKCVVFQTYSVRFCWVINPFAPVVVETIVDPVLFVMVTVAPLIGLPAMSVMLISTHH